MVRGLRTYAAREWEAVKRKAQPKKRPKPERKAGIKASPVPYHALPLLEVEELLASGLDRNSVVAHLMDSGVPQSTAYDRVKQVLDSWVALAKDKKPIRKAQARAMLLNVYREAMSTSPRQCAAAVSAVKEIKALDGLDEPDKHEHSHGRRLDESKLNDKQLEQLEEIYAVGEIADDADEDQG